MNPRFLALAVVVLFAPAVFAQDYEIKLSRPSKPGDELNLAVTGKFSQATTQILNGGTPQEKKQESTVQFNGVEKILEVDDKGRETKAALTVDTFTRTADGITTDIVPKGTVINCSVADKKPVFEIDGKAVDRKVAQSLGMVVDLGHGQPTDDEIFGTKDKKKKGDSWDMNVDLAKSSFAESAGGVELPEVSGKVTLDDVVGDNLKITSHVTGKIKPPLPPSIVVDDATMDATFGGMFPTDVNKVVPESKSEITISFTAHAEGPGGKVVIKSTAVQSTDHTSSLVK